MAIHGRGFPIRPHIGRPILSAAPPAGLAQVFTYIINGLLLALLVH